MEPKEQLRSNIITHMGEMKRLTVDIERAMKIQNHDHLDRLAVYWAPGNAVPPTICSTLPGCPLMGEEYRLPTA